jgi:hypothetical protein
MRHKAEEVPSRVGTSPRVAAVARGTAGRVSPSDPREVVDRRLRVVARKVKWVDLLAELGGIISVLLGTLLGAVICDHWCFPGGLSQGGRIFAFCLLVGIAAGYSLYRLVPILARRVSPAFAAYMIEQGVPWLKNTLLNFVFLRAELGGHSQWGDRGKTGKEDSGRKDLPPAFGRANSGRDFAEVSRGDGDRLGSHGNGSPREATGVEASERGGGSCPEEDLKRKILLSLGYTAAAQLARVPSHISVDYTPAIRAGYLLTIFLALGVGYLIFSPKNLFISLVRIANPWASLPAPTRVIIRQVDPGDSNIEQGSSVQVTAQVRGLRREEPVLLCYRSADGRLGGQTIAMSRSLGYRFEAELPEGKEGVLGDLVYWIQAGDARSPDFYLRVLPPVSVAVRQVKVRPPAYTGIPETTFPGGGDLQVVEGSEVVVEVEASEPLAELSLSFVEGRSGRLIFRPRNELVWELNFTAPRFSRPGVGSEVWECHFVGRTPQGRKLREGLRWQVEILPDRTPEVLLSGFSKEETYVPVDSRLTLQVEAEDPDFGLRHVQWCLGMGGATAVTRDLLRRLSPQPPFQGRWKSQVQLSLAELGVKPGDRLQVWVRAADSREPEPSWAESARFNLVVGPASRGQAPQSRDSLAGMDTKGQSSSEASAPRGGEFSQDNSSPVTDQTAELASKNGVGVPRSGRPREVGSGSSTQTGLEGEEVFELRPIERSPRLAQAPTEQGQAQAGEETSEGPTAGQNQGGTSDQNLDRSRNTPPFTPPDGSGNAGEQARQASGVAQEISGDNTQGGKLSHEMQGHLEGNVADSKDRVGKEGPSPDGVGPDQSRPATSEGEGPPESALAGGQRRSEAPSGGEGVPASRTPEDREPFQQAMEGAGSEAFRQPSKPSGRVEGLADPGEVFERILNYLRERQGVDLEEAISGEGLADSNLEGREGQSGQTSPAGTSESKFASEAGGQASGGKSSSDPKTSAGETSTPLKETPGRNLSAFGTSGSEPARSTSDASGDPQDLSEGQWAEAEEGTSGRAGGQLGGASKADLTQKDFRGATPEESGAKATPLPGRPSVPPRGSSPQTDSTASKRTSVMAEDGVRESGRQPKGTPDQVVDQKTLPELASSSLERGGVSQDPAAALAAPLTDSATPVERAEANSTQGERQSLEDFPRSQGNPSVAGPPLPQEANLPRAEMELPPLHEQATPNPEALSPTTSRHQSTAQGQQEGDRSGAGGAGGGQPSPQPGQGTPGTHSPNPSSAGNLVQGPGQEVGRASGSSASLLGAGAGSSFEQSPGPGQANLSSALQGPSGSREDLGGTSSTSGGGGSQPPNQRPIDRAAVRSVAGGNPTQGGLGTALVAEGSSPAQEPIYRPDDVNLAYAERATALVLDYLRHQVETGRADSALLETLGWTESDLQQFYREWARLRQEALRGDASFAKEEYSRALRSLGLRPPAKTLGPTSRQGSAPRVKELQIPQPPPEWVQYFRAYRAGVAKGD